MNGLPCHAMPCHAMLCCAWWPLWAWQRDWSNHYWHRSCFSMSQTKPARSLHAPCLPHDPAVDVSTALILLMEYNTLYNQVLVHHDFQEITPVSPELYTAGVWGLLMGGGSIYMKWSFLSLSPLPSIILHCPFNQHSPVYTLCQTLGAKWRPWWQKCHLSVSLKTSLALVWTLQQHPTQLHSHQQIILPLRLVNPNKSYLVILAFLCFLIVCTKWSTSSAFSAMMDCPLTEN